MRKIFKIAIMAIMLLTPTLAYDPFGFDLLVSPYNYNPLNPTHRSMVDSAMESNKRNNSTSRELKGLRDPKKPMKDLRGNIICKHNNSYCYEDDLED